MYELLRNMSAMPLAGFINGENPIGAMQQFGMPQIPRRQPFNPDLIPIRTPYDSELKYFKSNPNVAGMAAEDDAVILNPFSKNSEEQQRAVTMNEKARVYMRANNITPDYELTEQQKEKFKDYGDIGNIKRTIAARILTNDPSALDMTEAQKEWVRLYLSAPIQPK